MDTKLYVLLFWYWEGDSYLIHNFEGIFTDLGKVPEEVKNYIPMIKPRSGNVPYKAKYKGFYTTFEGIPTESEGSYSYPGFYTFTEIQLNELFTTT